MTTGRYILGHSNIQDLIEGNCQINVRKSESQVWETVDHKMLKRGIRSMNISSIIRNMYLYLLETAILLLWDN